MIQSAVLAILSIVLGLSALIAAGVTGLSAETNHRVARAACLISSALFVLAMMAALAA